MEITLTLAPRALCIGQVIQVLALRAIQDNSTRQYKVTQNNTRYSNTSTCISGHLYASGVLQIKSLHRTVQLNGFEVSSQTYHGLQVFRMFHTLISELLQGIKVGGLQCSYVFRCEAAQLADASAAT